MSPSAIRRSWVKGVFVLVLFAFAGLSIASGGLGLAPFAAIGGSAALVFAAIERRISRPSSSALAGLALLAWAALSFLWSPFDQPTYLVRLLLGAPLYVGLFILCKDLEGSGRELARAGVVLCVVSAGAFFAFELVTNGAVTAAHRADDLDQNQVWRNLGHGLSGWLLVLPAGLLLLPQGKRSIVLGAALLAVATACAFRFGLSSNVVGLAAAALAGALAWRTPRTGVAIVGALAAFVVLASPVLGVLADYAPDEWRSAIPVSWDLRLEAWSYAADRIADRPLWGWGFDASRRISETITRDGELFMVMPLHPHNAGLHIWFETGLIGAALAALLIYLAGREVATAPRLGRAQAMAAAAAAAGYVAMAQVSYGVWQEWWLAAVAWAGCAAALTGPHGRGA